MSVTPTNLLPLREVHQLDLLALSLAQRTVRNIPFWIVVLEAKNSSIEIRQSLPQLLTYSFVVEELLIKGLEAVEKGKE